jgi:hypothetical protein
LKLTAYISLTLLVLTACTTTKKSSSTNTVSADTVLQQAVSQQQQTNTRHTNEVRKDSTIGIAGQTVDDTIAAEDTEVPRTKDGKAVPRHFSKKENGLSIWVTIFEDGRIAYGATSDSLTLVIRNLTYKTDSLAHVLVTKDSSSVYASASKATTTETVKVKIRSFWAANWWWIVLVLVLGVLGVCAKTYLKR